MNKAEDGVKGLVNKGAQSVGLPAIFNTGSDNGSGNGNTDNGSNNDGAGTHWYNTLKNFASKLTGNWAILGMILNAIAWIEQVESLAGSLFSKDTRSRPTIRSAWRASSGGSTDQTVQAAVVDHNGDPTIPVLDRPVPELAPAP